MGTQGATKARHLRSDAPVSGVIPCRSIEGKESSTAQGKVASVRHGRSGEIRLHLASLGISAQ
jgi:hypothetical protein